MVYKYKRTLVSIGYMKSMSQQDKTYTERVISLYLFGIIYKFSFQGQIGCGNSLEIFPIGVGVIYTLMGQFYTYTRSIPSTYFEFFVTGNGN